MEANEPGFILLIVKILIAKISYPFIQAVYAAWMNAYQTKASPPSAKQLRMMPALGQFLGGKKL